MRRGVRPLGVSVVGSFERWGRAGTAPRFVGVENYRRLFTDHGFWQALANTGIFATLGVPTVIVVSFVAALLLHRSENRFFRALRSTGRPASERGRVTVLLRRSKR